MEWLGWAIVWALVACILWVIGMIVGDEIKDIYNKKHNDKYLAQKEYYRAKKARRKAELDYWDAEYYRALGITDYESYRRNLDIIAANKAYQQKLDILTGKNRHNANRYYY